MSTPALRILTLLARHGTAQYAQALPDMRAMFARQMSDVTHHVLVVDTALPPGHRTETDVEVIGGSNAAWEFSAWDAGIDHVGPRLDGYDFIHLATSAFRQLYDRYLDRFDSRILELMRGRAAAVGHIDYYNEPVSLLGIASQAWMRSSFVLLPPAELRRLGSLVSVTDRSAIFSGDSGMPFRDDAPLSETYRRNILGWLTGDGTGHGTAWHSRFALNEDTLAFFESKAIAILNEQMLTNRLRAQGCTIVDVTWLSAQAHALGAHPLGLIPDWRAQIAARGTGPAPSFPTT